MICAENEEKELNYQDVKIINTKKGYYEFKIHRKDAITNVQIKPNSYHDEKVKNGVFKGYISRAKAICSSKYVKEEIEFLKDIFVENGYNRKDLEVIEKQTMRNKRTNKDESKKFTSLPWIPKLSQKLRKSFKKAGIKITI